MAAKTTTHRNYSDSIKANAVKQVLINRKTLTAVAEEVGCSPVSVGNWIREARNGKSDTKTAQTPVFALATPQPSAVVSEDVRPASRTQPNGSTHTQLCQQVEILRELVMSRDRFIEDVLQRQFGLTLKR